MRRALATIAVVMLTSTACGGDGESAAGQTSPSATPNETAEASASALPSTPAASDGGPDDGSDGGPDDGSQDAPDDGSGSSGGNVIEIEIQGQRIEPNGKRVQVPAGEPITLEVESDRAGELHVHSSPEQTIAIKPGESRHRLTIDRPGVVDVEEHESGIVVLQLEVR